MASTAPAHASSPRKATVKRAYIDLVEPLSASSQGCFRAFRAPNKAHTASGHTPRHPFPFAQVGSRLTDGAREAVHDRATLRHRAGTALPPKAMSIELKQTGNGGFPMKNEQNTMESVGPTMISWATKAFQEP